LLNARTSWTKSLSPTRSGIFLHRQLADLRVELGLLTPRPLLGVRADAGIEGPGRIIEKLLLPGIDLGAVEKPARL
jgi:hypothetical protein